MKNELLKEEWGERLDDLQCNNLFLIQNPSKFCFGIDAVLLANFVKAKNGGHIIDLCTGSGIVPVLLSAKTSAKRITGIEIQKDIANMANRSVLYNSLEEKIDIINDDIANALKYIKPCSVDTIVVGISGKLLKENGKFFMIHKPSRLSEIFAVLKKNRIEPKRIRFVHPYINSKANLVLIEGIKGSGVWLDVEPPLAVYKDKNVYTDEVLKIYGR